MYCQHLYGNVTFKPKYSYKCQIQHHRDMSWDLEEFYCGEFGKPKQLLKKGGLKKYLKYVDENAPF